MKSIPFLLAVSCAGAAPLVAAYVDAELGIIVGAASLLAARIASLNRMPMPATNGPGVASLASTTGTYPRLLGELSGTRPDGSAVRLDRMRIAHVTQRLADAHWALSDVCEWRNRPRWMRGANERSLRRDWTHRCVGRLRGHEPSLPARDAIAIAQALYLHSRWRRASPEVAVDLELLELELVSGRAVWASKLEA